MEGWSAKLHREFRRFLGRRKRKKIPGKGMGGDTCTPERSYRKISISVEVGQDGVGTVEN